MTSETPFLFIEYYNTPCRLRDFVEIGRNPSLKGLGNSTFFLTEGGGPVGGYCIKKDGYKGLIEFTEDKFHLYKVWQEAWGEEWKSEWLEDYYLFQTFRNNTNQICIVWGSELYEWYREERKELAEDDEVYLEINKKNGFTFASIEDRLHAFHYKLEDTEATKYAVFTRIQHNIIPHLPDIDEDN